jgi:tRNA(Ile)-lysidine synthase
MARAPAELRLVADRAAKALAAADVPAATGGVALAVSGGADSLALLHAMRVLAGPRSWRLAVLTVDHGLRPGSAADAAFVVDHAKALGLPARLVSLTPADLERHRAAGLEGAARAARYAALWPAADALGCAFLATGHTLDDQAETVLLQLLRGAGPDGLAGMTVRSGRLLRPLLGVRRAETEACCAAVGIEPRQDPTNTDEAPLRNRVRKHLLPLLEALRPGATQTLARTATLAADERDWLDPLVEATLAATAVDSGDHPSSPGGVAGAAHPSPPGDADGAAHPSPPGGVDGGDRSSRPWATLPEGAPATRGWGDPRSEPAGFALDAAALSGLPVALGRRVVRAAARRAGLDPPDAAATDRVLALAGAADGAATGWPGGAAARAGAAVRLGPPPD